MLKLIIKENSNSIFILITILLKSIYCTSYNYEYERSNIFNNNKYYKRKLYLSYIDSFNNKKFIGKSESFVISSNIIKVKISKMQPYRIYYYDEINETFYRSLLLKEKASPPETFKNNFYIQIGDFVSHEIFKDIKEYNSNLNPPLKREISTNGNFKKLINAFKNAFFKKRKRISNNKYY